MRVVYGAAEVPPSVIRSLPYLLPVLPLSLPIEVPTMRIFSARHLLKSRLTSFLRDSNSMVHLRDFLPVLAIVRGQLSSYAETRAYCIQRITSPSPASSFTLICGPISSRSCRSPLKEPHLVPLRFLIRRNDIEPRRVNRMCL